MEPKHCVEIKCRCGHSAEWHVDDIDEDVHVSLSCCVYCSTGWAITRWLELQHAHMIRLIDSNDAGAKIGPIYHLMALEMQQLADEITSGAMRPDYKLF